MERFWNYNTGAPIPNVFDQNKQLLPLDILNSKVVASKRNWRGFLGDRKSVG